MYGEHYSDLLKWVWDEKEIVKSIAFFWVLKWFAKIGEISKIKNFTIKNFTDKVPTWMLGNSANILQEAWLLVGASYTTDSIFKKVIWRNEWEEPPELTWEQFIEALITVVLFRKLNKSSSSGIETSNKWKNPWNTRKVKYSNKEMT